MTTKDDMEGAQTLFSKALDGFMLLAIAITRTQSKDTYLDTAARTPVANHLKPQDLKLEELYSYYFFSYSGSWHAQGI